MTLYTTPFLLSFALTPSVSVRGGQGGRLAVGAGKGPGGLDTGLEEVEEQLWRSEGDLLDRELLS